MSSLISMGQAPSTYTTARMILAVIVIMASIVGLVNLMAKVVVIMDSLLKIKYILVSITILMKMLLTLHLDV